jgi:uncharacterized protein (UPF0218 family)
MYRLPDSLRPALAAPFGPVLDSRGALAAARGKQLVSVGDVVTQTFLDAGVVPKLMLVDGVTQRGARVENALAGLPQHGVRRERVRNPAAEVTKELIAAIDRALRAKGSTLVEVEGEEDLAALPCMIIAPDGFVVAYGQPPSRTPPGVGSAPQGAARDPSQAARGGVVVVEVGPDVRKRAQDILSQMEVN